MRQARATGNARLLDAAIALQKWSDHIAYPDGAWETEPTGTSCRENTVFGVAALGEAIRHHGDLLEDDVRTRWMERLRLGAEYVYVHPSGRDSFIHFTIGGALALVISGEVLDDMRYIERARDLLYASLGQFTLPNRLLYGEGYPQGGRTPTGCRPVDIGYNVEVSLPALALYGQLTRDEDVLDLCETSLKQHLEFMLPDGSWDNSWGTRNGEWTYWGARTGRGAFAAYLLLAGRSPEFGEAARRHLMRLSDSTHAGMLHPGLHSAHKNQAPCALHTITHAVGLATVLDLDLVDTYIAADTVLSCDEAGGVRHYPEVGVHLATSGPWRATVSNYDWHLLPQGHAAGGSMTLLWHQQLGPIVLGSMTKYQALEHSGMPHHAEGDPLCHTPHLAFARDGKIYHSLNDNDADVSHNTETNELRVSGRLRDAAGSDPENGAIGFTMTYQFTDDTVALTVQCDPVGDEADLIFSVPIVADQAETIDEDGEGGYLLHKAGGPLYLKTSAPGGFEPIEEPSFNHVPGVSTLPLAIMATGGWAHPVTVTLQIESTHQ
jgi:hypothetical protein